MSWLGNIFRNSNVQALFERIVNCCLRLSGIQWRIDTLIKMRRTMKTAQPMQNVMLRHRLMLSSDRRCCRRCRLQQHRIVACSTVPKQEAFVTFLVFTFLSHHWLEFLIEIFVQLSYWDQNSSVIVELLKPAIKESSQYFTTCSQYLLIAEWLTILHLFINYLYKLKGKLFCCLENQIFNRNVDYFSIINVCIYYVDIYSFKLWPCRLITVNVKLMR